MCLPGKRLTTFYGYSKIVALLWRGSSVVEQGTHKPLVVSSNLTLAIFSFKLSLRGEKRRSNLAFTVVVETFNLPQESWKPGCRKDLVSFHWKLTRLGRGFPSLTTRISLRSTYPKKTLQRSWERRKPSPYIFS